MAKIGLNFEPVGLRPWIAKGPRPSPIATGDGAVRHDDVHGDSLEP